MASRRSFGPVVLLGLASAGAAAWAGNNRAAQTAYGSIPLQDYPTMPLVTALGLVVLASWGVLLVTRGRVRRAVAVLAVVASVGALVAAIVGWSQVTGDLTDDLVARGVAEPVVERTIWPAVAILGSALSVVATALAVAWIPRWPEMGAKYDAPGAAAVPEKAPEEQSSLDLWKAMDEGRDPTAPQTDEG